MTRHGEISAVRNTAADLGTPWERKTPRNHLTLLVPVS